MSQALNQINQLKQANRNLFELATRCGRLDRKTCHDLAEEAVMLTFGVDRGSFYRGRKAGRPKQTDTSETIAKFVLFNILHRLFKRPVKDINAHYNYWGNGVYQWRFLDSKPEEYIPDPEDRRRFMQTIFNLRNLLQDEADSYAELFYVSYNEVLDRLSVTLHDPDILYRMNFDIHEAETARP